MFEKKNTINHPDLWRKQTCIHLAGRHGGIEENAYPTESLCSTMGRKNRINRRVWPLCYHFTVFKRKISGNSEREMKVIRRALA